MHFLKHFTMWGLCAVMLGTQPALIYAADTSVQNTDTYSTSASDTEEQTEEDSSEDNSSTESTDSTEDSSESSSDSSEETSSSSETEDTTGSSSSEDSDTTGKAEDTESSEDTEAPASEETSETSTESKKNKDISQHEESSTEDSSSTSSSKKDRKKSEKKASTDIEEEKELKKLDGTIIDEEDSAEKDEDPSAIIPKIYGGSQIVTRDDAEYMGDFVYFNQTDSVWNQNGYQIASAGCGPTSMAVVISSLTKQWVTPVDATVWAYEHGYYSSAGSAHALIPAMSEAYGLNCEGVGTDYASIKKALKKGKPVVALMGPGYFTRRGHFMVLIDIDENDNVTVADVGSRTRSAYKYALSDIISQSKSASAGGPFWVISKPKKKKKAKETVTFTSPQNEYVIHFEENGEEKTITFHLGDKVSYNGAYGLIVKFENRKAYITGENGQPLTMPDGSEAIPLSELRIMKEASPTVHGAMAAIMENETEVEKAGNETAAGNSSKGTAGNQSVSDNNTSSQ